jgi:hypothetical protein
VESACGEASEKAGKRKQGKQFQVCREDGLWRGKKGEAVENFLFFGLKFDYFLCRFRFEISPVLGQNQYCSTWNNSRIGPIPKMFHVEHRGGFNLSGADSPPLAA